MQKQCWPGCSARSLRLSGSAREPPASMSAWRRVTRDRPASQTPGSDRGAVLRPDDRRTEPERASDPIPGADDEAADTRGAAQADRRIGSSRTMTGRPGRRLRDRVRRRWRSHRRTPAAGRHVRGRTRARWLHKRVGSAAGEVHDGAKNAYLREGSSGRRPGAWAFSRVARSAGGRSSTHWSASASRTTSGRPGQHTGSRGVATAEFDAAQDAVWARLGVNTKATVPNPSNQLMVRALESTGRSWQLLPRNAPPHDPRLCGYCNGGCQQGEKQSTLLTYLQGRGRRRDSVHGRVPGRAASRRGRARGGRPSHLGNGHWDDQTRDSARTRRCRRRRRHRVARAAPAVRDRGGQPSAST